MIKIQASVPLVEICHYVLLMLLVLLLISNFTPQESHASSSDNLSGYAWSSNIGWISFNCTNDSCHSSLNYGVNVNLTTGNMSGYAWSSNIGWISFNESSGCPEPGCTTQPTVNLTTGVVSGWARALANGGGWDGWIKLGGPWAGSATFTGNNASGYSWGSTVVGWVDWSGVVSSIVPHTVTVTKAGIGTGTVTSTPAGISCGADCTEPFAPNVSVTLTATPAFGSSFVGWSGGDCSGTGTCTVTAATYNVTATFGINQAIMQTLTVMREGNGAGTVTSAPAGISCGADCSESYPFNNTSVTLTAAPTQGSTFVGWSGGGCSGTGTCTVTMNSPQAIVVTATFAIPDLYSINVGPVSGSKYKFGNPITYTGNAVNTDAANVPQGGYAGVEIDWEPLDGIYTYYAVPNASSMLGPFTLGESKALSYTVSSVPVGNHYYRFNVDSTNLVNELNNSNNRSSWVPIKVIDGTLTLGAGTLNGGGTTTVSWTSSNNVDECSVRALLDPNLNPDSWNALSGNEVTSPLYRDTTYVLMCDGSVLIDSDSVIVDVTPDLSISSRIVESGSTVLLEWDTHNQDSTANCILKGGSLEQAPPNDTVGSLSVPITAKTTFTLTCETYTGSGDFETAQATVEVVPRSFES